MGSVDPVKLRGMYPNQEAAEFEFEYYQPPRIQLVEKPMKSFGLIKSGIDM